MYKCSMLIHLYKTGHYFVLTTYLLSHVLLDTFGFNYTIKTQNTCHLTLVIYKQHNNCKLAEC